MSQIVNVKWSLPDANTVTRALQAYYAELLGQIANAGGVSNMPALGQEAGRVEGILRRDFDTEPEPSRGGRR